MKRIAFALLLACALPAQDAQTAKKEEKKDAQAESPSPTSESALEASIDAGVRFLGDVRGDFNTYRSVVNLGEGLRLMNTEWHYRQPSARFLDTLHLSASSWGGDPYNSGRLDMGKKELWRFRSLYSNIAYYNFLPSFAAQQPGAAGQINQRAYDVANRGTDMLLELLPTKLLTPYFGYVRSTGFGDGITPLVVEGNEYPLRNAVRWGQDEYRGGVRVESRNLHAGAEYGGTAFKDDQSVYSTERLSGNRTTPILGTPLSLTNALQSYGIRGTGYFARVHATWAWQDKISVTGHYLFSAPTTYSHYSDSINGSLVQLGALRFYDRQFDVLAGDARMPHKSGMYSIESTGWQKVRFRSSYFSDRSENASTALLLQQINSGTTQLQATQLQSSDRLKVGFDRSQTDVTAELHQRLTVRGGFRFEWGDAILRGGSLNRAGVEAGTLRRNVGLAGFRLRPFDRLTATFDLEKAAGDETYFRGSLRDYTRIRSQVRYQLMSSFLLTGGVNQMINKNPAQTVNLDFEARQMQAGVQWMPKAAKHVSLIGDYTRSTISSDLSFILPDSYQRANSFYRDHSHVVTGLLELSPAMKKGTPPRFTLGGSMFYTSGSRPMRYYQPMGRVLVPVNKKLQTYGEWRWYGHAEPYFLYQGFRTHMVVAGVRIQM